MRNSLRIAASIVLFALACVPAFAADVAKA